jgi:hypothetical protein
MINEEMLKQDLEKAVKLLLQSGNNTKQQVKLLLEDCLETYFKPKKYLTFDELEIGKWYVCKLNGTIYLVITSIVFGERDKEPEVHIYDRNKKFIWSIDNEDKQFFNDLHLELVEE